MELTAADRLELHELMGRYGDAVDDRAWNVLRNIFTTDAVFEIPHLDVTLSGLDRSSSTWIPRASILRLI